jgi:hypothetical protein
MKWIFHFIFGYPKHQEASINFSHFFSFHSYQNELNKYERNKERKKTHYLDRKIVYGFGRIFSHTQRRTRIWVSVEAQESNTKKDKSDPVGEFQQMHASQQSGQPIHIINDIEIMKFVYAKVDNFAFAAGVLMNI